MTINPSDMLLATLTQDVLDFSPPEVGSPCNMMLPLSNAPTPLLPPQAGDQMVDPTQPSVSNPSSSPIPQLQPSSTINTNLTVKARE